MRIAIVGAGISGLVAAHLLPASTRSPSSRPPPRRRPHEHVRVDTANETHHVDTGFIVFNDRNYPNFERLLDPPRRRLAALDHDLRRQRRPRRLRVPGGSPNGLFAKRSHLVTPWFHRMLADLPRFNRAARELLRERDEGPSLGHWLEQQRFSRPFIDRLIVPQASAVWSADPAPDVGVPGPLPGEFFDNHGMLGCATAPTGEPSDGGSARYVEALLRRFAGRIWLETPVTRGHPPRRPCARHAPRRRAGRSTRSSSPPTPTRRWTARRRQRPRASASRRHPLSAQRGGPPHRHRMLPRRRRAWASWNFHLASRRSRPHDGHLPHESPPVA